jgi:hypothetical protein
MLQACVEFVWSRQGSATLSDRARKHSKIIVADHISELTAVQLFDDAT